MPKQFVLLIFISIILYLFWVDRKNNEDVSGAIWIPFVWIALAASRSAYHWLNLGLPIGPIGNTDLEGNPVNSAVFTILIISGMIVLLRRRLNWSSVFKNNAWIWLYFAFGALSFLWCDYPFVAFKRWIKSLGTIIMILVILSETRPYLAFGLILKRIAFLFLPLSVLFVKFYPAFGRAYTQQGGPMYTGVGLQKNSLGLLCLITAIYFSWNLLQGRKSDQYSASQKLHYSVYIIILPMIVWLLYMCNSVTSQICLIIAICIFLLGRHPTMDFKPERLFTVCITCAVLFIILEFAFDIKANIISLFGRRPDLTNRIYIWQQALSMVRDPIIGYGFESFYSSAWSADEEERFVSTHNGYLEMYLNLGIIGLTFVAGWILSGLKRAYKQLQIDYAAAILRFVMIVVACFFSWTEASFAGTGIMWLFLLFASMTIPHGENARQ